MRNEPLTAAELTACLRSCVSPTADAAALLALPLHELPSASLRLSGDAWHWRGDLEPVDGAPLAALADLVARNAVDGDLFVDPSDAPWRWVRLVASGCGSVVLGCGQFVGGPAMAADTGVSPDDARSVVAAWVRGELVSPPAVVDAPSGTLLVDGDPSSWRLRAGRPAPAPDLVAAPPVADRLGTLRAHLARAWGAPVTVRGASSLVCDLGDGWRAEVPVACTDGGTTVGAPVRVSLVPPVVDGLPDGWAVAGADGDRLVAVSPEGVRAYLTR